MSLTIKEKKDCSNCMASGIEVGGEKCMYCVDITEWEFVEWVEKAVSEAVVKGYDKEGNEYTAVGCWFDSTLKEIQDNTIKLND